MITQVLNNTGRELTHFARFLLAMELPRTQTTRKEQEAIKKYSSDKMIAVEIGVFEGYNTSNIAMSINKSGTLYAIDPFMKGRLGICYGELISRNHLKREGVENRVKFIKKFSFDASADVTVPVDFIFIDGDHSYEGIKMDWKIWSEKLKAGGIIALHDTSVPTHNENVKGLGSYKYFNEVISFDPRFELLETVDSLNILKKR